MRTPALVLDNSTVIAWALGEGHPGADAVMDLLVDGKARVPSLWPMEFANVLLVAERRKRLTEADAVRVKEMVLSLPMTVVPDDPTRILSTVLALAREQDLSVYDAAYLDLAMREGLPLATVNQKLRDAARRCSVPLLVEEPIRPEPPRGEKRKNPGTGPEAPPRPRRGAE